MKVDYITFSEAGKRRANQDFCRVVEMADCDRVLFVLCDGMGGHSMGDVAAQTVCNSICKSWEYQSQGSDSDQAITAAFSQAAADLVARSSVVRPVEMGTTLVVASIAGDQITIAHCGDSRCYLLRGGEVLYQTRDHVDVARGADVVSRCIFSMNPEVAIPDVARFNVEPGDRIFLCSDGVYKSMAPNILAARLQDDRPLAEVVDVIKFMCEKFSTDNYTGILVEIK